MGIVSVRLPPFSLLCSLHARAPPAAHRLIASHKEEKSASSRATCHGKLIGQFLLPMRTDGRKYMYMHFDTEVELRTHLQLSLS